MNKTRLWLATALTWAAARIAPKEMGPVFAQYAKLLELFPAELRSGRTYGVLTVPWSLRREDKGVAELMQHRAIAACVKARVAIEAVREEGQ